MNYLERDTLGIYRKEKNTGPGPVLMGADTLVGDDVYNHQDEKLGDIKEIMLDMSTGTVAYAGALFWRRTHGRREAVRRSLGFP